MKCTLALVGILFSTAALEFGSPQSEQRGTTVAGEMVQLRMNRQEAAKKFSLCCKTIPLGDNAIIVQNLKNSSHELGGMVYFDHDFVGGVAADRSWSSEAAPYETALAFYRLVDQRTHGTPTRATIYAYSREADNASIKYVVLQFPDGQRIRFEMTHLDPGADISQQVAVSECVGACVDW
jgi:hypothetical protein